ncbi:MAG TPA: hypothetical protein VGQ24_09690 [Gemmatimonadales bacterium]|jgi:hypothetical protein|nr:hypothetical protein [Gemmatimonadales bacterium]
MSHIRVREFDLRDLGTAFKAAEVDAAALAAVNQHTLEPVAADEVTIRQMDVCHDQYDRTLERFPVEYLQRFAETLPGKGLMAGHQTRGALPLGKFHSAEVVSRMQDHPIFVQPGGKSLAVEPVPGFETKRRKVNVLSAGFYYPKDAASEPMDARIRQGVYNSVSIGFSYADINCDVCKKSYFSDCPHWAGYPAERDNPDSPLVTLTYSGTAEEIQRHVEAVETSIVYLGAQPNARIRKAYEMCADGAVDVRALCSTPYGIDEVALKVAEGLARQFGSKQRVWGFSSGGKSSVVSGTPADLERFFGALTGGHPDAAEDEVMLEKLRKMFGLADDADEAACLKALETSRADQDGSAEKLAAVEKRALDLEAQVKALEPVAEIGRKALARTVKSILDDDFRLTGTAENAELALITEHLSEQRDYEKLMKLADAKAAAVLAKFPAGTSGDTSIRDEDEQAPKQAARDAAFV